MSSSTTGIGSTSPPGPPPFPEMVWIPGGSFWMGADNGYPEERPAHEVSVDGFWMDSTQVTNADYARFVEETGWTTNAETPPRPEDYPGVPRHQLRMGSGVFQQPSNPVDLRNPGNWWEYVGDADWRHPWGPESTLDGKDDFPVVHIAYEDARAYAEWAGKQLPTEAQWEFAARGGLDRKTYVWGDDFYPEGQVVANTWEGRFPWENTKSTAPGPMAVRSFPPNGYGLYEMAGNVWEWTTDYFQQGHEVVNGCCPPHNPTGPERGVVEAAAPTMQMRVVKGGSFLCSHNYCRRYRPAARHGETVDTSTCHIGFRCISSASQESAAPAS